MWTRLGYFLRDDTTLHLRVEIRCMHHTEHDWLELWTNDDYLLSVCWTNECLSKLMIFVNVFLLIVVIWFFFCINFFYNNLTPRNFEPCGWYLWWSQTFVGGSRMTAVEYDKWDSFVDPLSRRDDVGIILGELCFVNQLFHSWFLSFILLS